MVYNHELQDVPQ